jgi:ribose 5-phosphate isomerase B
MSTPSRYDLDLPAFNTPSSSAFSRYTRPNGDQDLQAGSGRPLRVAIASDHRGFEAKSHLLPRLAAMAHVIEVHDVGCEGDDRACDYPDYASPAARRVATGDADVAILLDAAGIGMAIVANKVPGIRAATCHDEFTARIAREHNHCNVLCVGTDLVGERALFQIVEIFLNTRFVGGRHVRRVAKIAELESAAAHAPARTMRATS